MSKRGSPPQQHLLQPLLPHTPPVVLACRRCSRANCSAAAPAAHSSAASARDASCCPLHWRPPLASARSSPNAATVLVALWLPGSACPAVVCLAQPRAPLQQPWLSAYVGLDQSYVVAAKLGHAAPGIRRHCLVCARQTAARLEMSAVGPTKCCCAVASCLSGVACWCRQA